MKVTRTFMIRILVVIFALSLISGMAVGQSSMSSDKSTTATASSE